MRSGFLLAAAAAVLTGGIATIARSEPTAPAPVQPADTAAALRPFASERELAAFLRSRLRRRTPSHALQGAPAAVEAVAQAAPSLADESVTNTQHAGVDEGGIVKVHGDFLVILRRGRLFTVAIGDEQLRPVSMVDAYGPEMSPDGAWYDELLVADGQVVVIGYSYARGGTEVSLFDLDRAGRLEYRSTYHLRSNDYYSSRNYASRLIGNRLIMYTPLYLWPEEGDLFAGFPAIRRWRPGAREEEFRRLVPASRVYRSARPLGPDDELALHTVTVCELGRGTMDCEADAVMGPPGRVFYVSPSAVYVWVSDWARGARRRAASTLYRLSLAAGRPTAIGVHGAPVDQFSFLESEDGHLNVLVRSGARGEAMWDGESPSGGASLLRFPVRRFGDGTTAVPGESYRALPTPPGYTFHNRFVGEYLLYGVGSGWGPPRQDARYSVYAVRWTGGTAVELPLPHGVDRIEAMGTDAVVIGTEGRDLHFTGVDLGRVPRLAQRYVRADASQGELRSHGFFFRAEGRESGTIGLPIRTGGRPGYEHLYEGSASILFLRTEPGAFRELGALEAGSRQGRADDGCRASCVDWYGNARPLFLRGRTFALLGYELVEGRLADGRVQETRRISFAPRPGRLGNGE